jgi:hypothetical protein
MGKHDLAKVQEGPWELTVQMGSRMGYILGRAKEESLKEHTGTRLDTILTLFIRGD